MKPSADCARKCPPKALKALSRLFLGLAHPNPRKTRKNPPERV